MERTEPVKRVARVGAPSGDQMLPGQSRSNALTGSVTGRDLGVRPDILESAFAGNSTRKKQKRKVISPIWEFRKRRISHPDISVLIKPKGGQNREGLNNLPANLAQMEEQLCCHVNVRYLLPLRIPTCSPAYFLSSTRSAPMEDQNETPSFTAPEKLRLPADFVGT